LCAPAGLRRPLLRSPPAQAAKPCADGNEILRSAQNDNVVGLTRTVYSICHSEERKRRRISCTYRVRVVFPETWDAPCGAPSFCSCRKTVKKEHAREKGFLQSRPSPWTLILRRLRSMRAIRMRVRAASLRSARAEPCGWECRGNASRCPTCHS